MEVGDQKTDVITLGKEDSREEEKKQEISIPGGTELAMSSGFTKSHASS